MLKIKQQREKLGYSHRSLANAIGVHHSCIPKYEDGSLFPAYDTAWKLSDVLKINKVEMFKTFAKAKEERRKQKHE